MVLDTVDMNYYNLSYTPVYDQLFRCLTNIAAGDYEQAREVLQAVPNIILVLDSDVSSMAVREQVCWTVGNIAGDCDQFRQVLLANGCLLAILRFLARCVDSTYMEGARTNAWALSNLMRGSTSAAGLIDSGTWCRIL